MIFLILTMIMPVHNYEELIYKFNAATNEIDGWITLTGSTVFFTQGDQILYGGSSPKISRIFLDLSPHYKVKVKMEFWLNDLINFGQLIVLLDGLQIYNKQYNNSTLSSFSGPTPYEYPQKKRTSSIYLEVSGLSKSGIRKFEFYIERCPQGCEACDNFDFLICKKWKLVNQSFNQYHFSNLQGWQAPEWYIQSDNLCAKCHFLQQFGINYQGVLSPHKGVMLRFFRKFTIGSQNIIINGVNYIVSQPTDFYLIELIINDHIAPNLIIQIEQGQIRDVELYYQPDDIYFGLESLNCFSVINNVCFSCLDGWEFEEIQNQCHPSCGNKMIQELEECDDGNEVQNDGCYLCKFECDVHCINCQFGRCNKCETGYILSDNYAKFPQCYPEIIQYQDNCLFGYLKENGKCYPYCGDLIQIIGLEECKEDTKVQSYEQYQCKLYLDVHCIICDFGKCQQCDAGYILSDNQDYFPQCYPEIPKYPNNCLILEKQMCRECIDGYQQVNGCCYPFCGDGIQILGLEECDDGNQIPYDGCFNCIFQCQQNCILCIEGVCYQYCEEGFVFMDQSCISICGDGFITNLEECEDGNNIPYDGCYLCKFSCPLNCLECFNGYCLQCDTNYQLLSNNQCESIQYQYKECDDQNDGAQDGCHKFQVQLDWVCRRLDSETFSECSYFKYPKLHIQYKKMLWNKQYVTLTFSQPVKVGKIRILLEAFTYTIQNLPESQYIIKTHGSQEISRTIQYVEYQLEIEIFQLLEFKPILNINFFQEITNSYDSKLYIKAYNKALLFPTYLNEKQIYYSKIVQSVNRYALYSYGGACSLMIFQGRYEVLIEIFNLLSFQNYLKYINVKFPQNLLLYFESYDLLSIEAIYELLNVQQLQGVLFYNEFKEASGKFQFYKQNADLLTNLEWQIIQSSFYILLILLSIGAKKFILSNYFRTRIYIYLIQQKNNSDKEVSQKLLLWLYKRCQQLIGVVDLFSKNGLKTILLVNGWDLIFKGMLYLKYLIENKYRDIFSLVLALVLIFFYIIFILNSNNLYPRNYLIKIQQLKEKRFEVFNLGISFCFIGFLIFLESSEILQLGLISLINLMQLKLIYNYRKIIRQFFTQMVIQTSVLIFTLSSFVYIQEATYYINEEIKIKCGWFHIFLLSFGLLIEISQIIIEQIKYYFGMCSRKKERHTPQDQFIFNY